MSQPNPLQPGEKFGNGRFTIARRLGSGGMGEVWLAEDERLHQTVALKFLPPEIRGDPVAFEWLRRETARCHTLSHPNIIRIHDLHEDADGTAYIVMEYINGPTLADLQTQQPDNVFRWNYLKPLIEQLCAALDYAHNEKIVHRDLKPANMMVTASGRLKLADFGLAALVSDSKSRVTRERSTSGTLNYMSPQQIKGEHPEPANDIYALGVTLYELLTGQMPFYTGDVSHQILHIAPEPIPDRLAVLRIKNPVPTDVAALVMACLAKEPDHRPASAAAVAAWIGFDVAAKPPPAVIGTPAPSTKSAPVRKKPRNQWAVAAVMLAVLLTASTGYWTFRLRPGWIPKWPVRSAVVKSAPPVAEAKPEPPLPVGWIPLFDGKTLSGWTAPDPSNWEVDASGAITADGEKSHLFSPERYTNFIFKAEIKMAPGANGGMFFRARLAHDKARGYEAQAANEGDPKNKTGSLFGLENIPEELVPDDTWFTQEVLCIANRIIIRLNGQILVNYTDKKHLYAYGHLALQQWAPGHRIWYRNVMIKPLPHDRADAFAAARQDIPDLPK